MENISAYKKTFMAYSPHITGKTVGKQYIFDIPPVYVRFMSE